MNQLFNDSLPARPDTRRGSDESRLPASGAVPTQPSDHNAVLELRVTRDGMPTRRLRIGAARCTLGSGDFCTLRLGDSSLRPLHAVILQTASRVLIRGYTIPIEVNGHFTIEAFLSSGDAFRLGHYRFELLEIAAATAAATAPTDGPSEAPIPASDPITSVAELEERLDMLTAGCESLTERSVDTDGETDRSVEAYMSRLLKGIVPECRPENQTTQEPQRDLGRLPQPPGPTAWVVSHASIRDAAVTLRKRARFDLWQAIGLMLGAGVLLVCGVKNPAMTLIWNTAAGLAVALAAFMLYDMSRKLTVANRTAGRRDGSAAVSSAPSG